MKYPVYWPQFFTATILEWKPLLKQDKYKEIVIDSLLLLVTDQRIKLYAFAFMFNHIHLIWQPIKDYTAENIQHSLMSFTSHQFKNELKENHLELLENFKINAKDRQYQFWERNALSIELISKEVFMQKLEYIHWNPVKAGLCKLPEEYYFSSAKFYEYGIDDFGIITHYNE